jgi:hypothetical protein
MHHEQRTHVVDSRHPPCAADLVDTYHGHAVTDPGIVLHRHIKNRRLAAVGSIWALASLRSSPGARRHFDARRAAGDWNRQAQRHPV